MELSQTLGKGNEGEEHKKRENKRWKLYIKLMTVLYRSVGDVSAEQSKSNDSRPRFSSAHLRESHFPVEIGPEMQVISSKHYIF